MADHSDSNAPLADGHCPENQTSPLSRGGGLRTRNASANILTISARRCDRHSASVMSATCLCLAFARARREFFAFMSSLLVSPIVSRAGAH
jgi:hypothetical protein